MNMVPVVLTVAVIALAATIANAGGVSLSFERTVPDGATMEYRVRGRLVQRLNLRPGTYTITIREH